MWEASWASWRLEGGNATPSSDLWRAWRAKGREKEASRRKTRE